MISPSLIAIDQPELIYQCIIVSDRVYIRNARCHKGGTLSAAHVKSLSEREVTRRHRRKLRRIILISSTERHEYQLSLEICVRDRMKLTTPWRRWMGFSSHSNDLRATHVEQQWRRQQHTAIYEIQLRPQHDTHRTTNRNNQREEKNENDFNSHTGFIFIPSICSFSSLFPVFTSSFFVRSFVCFSSPPVCCCCIRSPMCQCRLRRWARAQSSRATANYFERLQRTLFFCRRIFFIFHFQFTFFAFCPSSILFNYFFATPSVYTFFFSLSSCCRLCRLSLPSHPALVFGFAHWYSHLAILFPFSVCDLLVRHTVLQAMLPDKSDDETVTMENHHLHVVLYWQRCVCVLCVCRVCAIVRSVVSRLNVSFVF